MNYKQIADQIVKEHGQKIIPALIIINLISQFMNITNVGLFGIILSLLLLCISYGAIIVSKKAWEGRSDEINTMEDAFVGLSQFTTLFKTYFIKMIKLTLYIIGESIVYLMLLVILPLKSFSTGAVINGDANIVAQVFADPLFFIATLLFLGFAFYTVISYSLDYLVTPYLIEYGITGSEAMAQSKAIINGHRKEYIKLYLSYIVPMLAIFLGVNILSFLLERILPSSFVTILKSITLGILQVYVFTASLSIATYGFVNDIIPESIKHKTEESL